VLTRLRAATAGHHARLERRLDLVGDDLDLHRYRRVLETFFAFYSALEPAIDRVFPPSAAPGAFRPIARAPLLRADLQALDAPVAEGVRPEVPAVTRPEHAVGCLYVVEGASLGGQIISRHVQRRLGIGAARGGAFFTGLGDATRARWLAFVAWLEDFGARSTAPDEIAVAACATFAALERRLEDAGLLR
jgi:heme oxygenase